MYAPKRYEKLRDQPKSNARTLTQITVATWNYPITEQDNVFTDNCFPGRCWAVPYDFDPMIVDGDKVKIKNAMNELELDICIR